MKDFLSALWISIVLLLITIATSPVTVQADAGQAVNAIPMPEPVTLLLIGTGLAGIAGIFRKRLRSRKTK